MVIDNPNLPMPTGPPRPRVGVSRAVDHPAHYGGKDNPYEAIKVIEAHNLNFSLGNAVKYILRAGSKGSCAEDLRKAVWYLNRELEQYETTSS